MLKTLLEAIDFFIKAFVVIFTPILIFVFFIIVYRVGIIVGDFIIKVWETIKNIRR